MSTAQFKDCPRCGEKIHISKSACPKCGHRKRLRWFHWALIVLAGLILLGAVNGGENASNTTPKRNISEPVTQTAEKPDTPEPDTQRRFVETVASYQKIFRDAENELQQSSARVKRRQALADLGMGMHIDGWIGSIKRMTTTSDGDAAIIVSLGSNIDLHTWSNAISDMRTGTLIPHGTELYEILSRMERGKKIKFSGTFLTSNEDYYYETSVTIEGSMSKPEFLFKFTAISKLD